MAAGKDLGEDLPGPTGVEIPLRHPADDVGHGRGTDGEVVDRAAPLVERPQHVLLHPVARYFPLTDSLGEILEVGDELTPLIDEDVGVVGGNLPRRGERLSEHRRRIPHRLACGREPLLRHRHRHEVGLGEVAVVARLLLVPLGPGDAGRIVPAAGLLRGLPHLGLGRLPLLVLPGRFVDQRPLDGAEAVHVFDFDDRRLGDPAAVAGDVEVDIGVDPQAPLLHVAVTDAEVDKQQLELVEPGAGLLRRPQIGLADDLTQRRAGPIQIDSRVAGAGRLVMHALSRILLEMDASDPDVPRQGPLRIDHLEGALRREGEVELRDLIALGEIGVEVVLPIPLRERRDLAAEGQRRPDGELEGRPIHHRERPGEAEAGGADLRVWRGTERGGAAAEELRPRLQLDVDFKADDRGEGRGGGRCGGHGGGAREGLRVEGRRRESAWRRVSGAGRRSLGGGGASR